MCIKIYRRLQALQIQLRAPGQAQQHAGKHTEESEVSKIRIDRDIDFSDEVTFPAVEKMQRKEQNKQTDGTTDS